MRQSQEGRALRQFTLSTGKSAGRNSSGRITVFHRGGGSKRLQRRIDLKRSTSSMGIVERIEYDPNRSSRIAPVRWIEGVIKKKIHFFMNFDSKMLFLNLLNLFIMFFISICLLKMGVPLCAFCDTESEQTSSENDAGIGAQESIGARPLGESASNLEGEPSGNAQAKPFSFGRKDRGLPQDINEEPPVLHENPSYDEIQNCIDEEASLSESELPAPDGVSKALQSLRESKGKLPDLNEALSPEMEEEKKALVSRILKKSANYLKQREELTENAFRKLKNEKAVAEWANFLKKLPEYLSDRKRYKAEKASDSDSDE